MQTKEYTLDIGGKTITAQFNDLTNQANGSVILSCENTVVMATAVMSDNKKDGLDYFPLSVEYEERYYSVGKILGGRFMRREGRPTTNAILTGRMIDRTVRPLFEQYIRNEVQVIITILSLGQYSPDILAINAASLALATSDIPWNGPVSAVRIGANNSEEFIINPFFKSEEEELKGRLDLIACGKDKHLNMIEVRANEISDELTAKAFQKASDEIEKIQEFQKKVVKEIGKEKTMVEKSELSSEAIELFKSDIEPRLEEMVFNEKGNETIEKLKNIWIKSFIEKTGETNISLPLAFYEETIDDLIHKEALENNRRVDGRSMDQIRSLYAQAGGVAPSVHGVGIFYRGGTHVFSALTLGGRRDALALDGIEIGKEKRFIHHYNFPPFSTGETGRVGGTNRRMIGHGALAEKALLAVLPSEEEFPYTIRIVSEAMASNGSTSMASTCGSTIALMDAGVPIKAPVAGIAMGLIMKNESNYKILTDIQGPEDHYGDMDFKVTGTKNGITAIQMDVKVDGIPIKILSEALTSAQKARLEILDVITKEISEPRPEIPSHAPKIIKLEIKPEQIGGVIGPGGKVINHIKESMGVDEIDINDDGSVYITGKQETVENAKKMIEALTRSYSVGDRFEGRVVKIFDFGAIVEIGPQTDGLVHISEIASFRVEDINKVLREGMIVPVIIKETDGRGKIKLSIKEADPKFIKLVKKENESKPITTTATKPKRNIG